MMRKEALVLGALAILLLAAPSFAENNWPAWRGPDATGAAPAATPPVQWSETENIKWKTDIPGEGHSTPIVWGNQIILQTAIPTAPEGAEDAPPQAAPPPGPPRGDGPPPRGQGGFRGAPGAPQGGPGGPGGGPGGGFRRPGGGPGAPSGGRGGPGGRGGFGGSQPTAPYKFCVISYERISGEKLWETCVQEVKPHEGHHPTGSMAPYSPVTDGEHIWASFGSRGLHCLDMDGKVVWSTELVELHTRNSFGEGSSPALAGDAIIVVLDQEGDSKIAAFDKNTGKPLWEKNRDERTSWATPLPVEVNGRLEVITSATNLIRSYDAKTGDIIWQCAGQTENVIPTPVTGFGKVFCTSGYRGSALQAIELGKTGDLTGSGAIVWKVDRATPYVPSPLLADGRIYVLSSNRAVLSCYDAQTGKALFTEKDIEGLGTIYASPLAAGGKIYIADREGKTAVLKEGDTFEVLALNTLSTGVDASPIALGDTLYLRGGSRLYAIAD